MTNLLKQGTEQRRPPTPARLGARAAIGVTALLTAAIGGTTVAGLWSSANGMRAQAEQHGEATVRMAAGRIADLQEASAANVARALDLIVEEHAVAQAATTAILIEAAEGANRNRAYVDDVLRQIVFRSPIERLDVWKDGEAAYSSHAEETPDQPLTVETTAGRFSGPAAQGNGGLRKTAWATDPQGTTMTRVLQVLNSAEAASFYGQTTGEGAREEARRQARAVAELASHAIETAEDAGWSRLRIERTLADLVENTTLVAMRALTADGRIIYRAGAGRDLNDTDRGRLGTLGERGQGSVSLEGRWDRNARWVVRAGALRPGGRFLTTLEMTSRTGTGTLLTSAWQEEADRIAADGGVNGVWIVRLEPDGVELLAAAPRPGQAAGGEDAWSKWNGELEQRAHQSRGISGATSTAIIDLRNEAGTVLSAAPADAQQETVVLMETNADQVVSQLRTATERGLMSAGGLIVLLGLATTWAVRRSLTAPIEAIADAAACLGAGTRPPRELTQPLARRKDELGGLARTFEQMSDDVVERSSRLEEAVAGRTSELRRAVRRLTAAEEAMDHDLKLARTVQEALTPAGRLCRFQGWEALPTVHPAQDLGGDFIVIEALDERRTLVAVCDVSGKGVAAALFMAVAQETLRRAARESKAVGSTVTTANRELTENNAGCLFVTGFIAVLHADGNMAYVLAGHEPPWLLHNDGTARKLPRNETIPLGLEEEAEFPARLTSFKAGQTLMAYTDGVTDTFNPDDEAFGEERLAQCMARQQPGTALEGVLDNIWTARRHFARGTKPFDDTTALLLRRTA